MTSREFIFWFGGFVHAVEGIPTQSQWDFIKTKLSDVGDPIKWPIDDSPFTTSPITVPFWQQPHITNPFDLNRVTCDGTNVGSVVTDGFIQTTDTAKYPAENSTLSYTTNKDVVYTIGKKNKKM